LNHLNHKLIKNNKHEIRIVSNLGYKIYRGKMQ